MGESFNLFMNANASNFAAGSQFIKGATGFGGSIIQANAQSAQGDYQRKIYELNAQIADTQASDAIKAGDRAAEVTAIKGKQYTASQRAAFAAQGIKIDSGSALDVVNETDDAFARDQMTIKNNAWREAWGFRVSAENMRTQGGLASAAANLNASNTLLTGGLNAASDFLKGASYLKNGKVK